MGFIIQLVSLKAHSQHTMSSPTPTLDPEAIFRMIQQETKLVENQENEKRALNQGYSRRATVYFKKNNTCQYHVDCVSTKVMFEACEDTFVKLNERVLTETVEVWNCNGCELMVNVPISTIQVDMCRDLVIRFPSKENFGSLVWAGVHNMRVLVGDDELVSDVSQGESVPNYCENFDQFIIRYVDGKLKQELIVRLENGFPTTNREADEFDAQQKKNDAAFEAHVRSMLSSTFVEEKLENLSRQPVEPTEDASATENK